jgi:hypothetical protein
MKQILNTLYVQTQGTYLHLDHDTLKLEIEKQTKLKMPLHHIGGIVVFVHFLFIAVQKMGGIWSGSFSMESSRLD